MGSEIKILFTSDLHLGIENDALKIPDSARINTFKKITALAKSRDILLIAGDLIDNIKISNDILDMIKDEISNLKKNGTEVIYTLGAGEISEHGTVPSFIYDFEASHVFSKPEKIDPYEYNKNDQKLYIYGIPSYNGYDISKIKKSSSDGFHIGLFHVDFDTKKEGKNSLVYELQKKDFKNLDLDFYALGHKHNFKMFKVENKIIGAYPGSPEASSNEETGDRYAISFSIEDNEISEIRRHSVNTMKLDEMTIDCSKHAHVDQIIELLNDVKSKNLLLKLNLIGSRNFKIDFMTLNNYKENLFNFEIVDNSKPTIDLLVSEFENEDTIRGEFFKIIKKQLNKSDLFDEIDSEKLRNSLNMLNKDRFEYFEDWLCSLLNA